MQLRMKVATWQGRAREYDEAFVTDYVPAFAHLLSCRRLCLLLSPTKSPSALLFPNNPHPPHLAPTFIGPPPSLLVSCSSRSYFLLSRLPSCLFSCSSVAHVSFPHVSLTLLIASSPFPRLYHGRPEVALRRATFAQLQGSAGSEASGKTKAPPRRAATLGGVAVAPIGATSRAVSSGEHRAFCRRPSLCSVPTPSPQDNRPPPAPGQARLEEMRRQAPARTVTAPSSPAHAVPRMVARLSARGQQLLPHGLPSVRDRPRRAFGPCPTRRKPTRPRWRPFPFRPSYWMPP